MQKMKFLAYFVIAQNRTHADKHIHDWNHYLSTYMWMVKRGKVGRIYTVDICWNLTFTVIRNGNGKLTMREGELLAAKGNQICHEILWQAICWSVVLINGLSWFIRILKISVLCTPVYSTNIHQVWCHFGFCKALSFYCITVYTTV